MGRCGFGDSYDASSEKILFERVFSTDGLKKLMDYLAGRYSR